MSLWDVVIIGAGPAGMAAAATAADIGGDVMVLDEQASPGGQIYRGILKSGAALTGILGEDYRYGHALADTLVRHAGQGRLRYESAATVWRVDPDGAIAYSVAGKAHQVRARHIILATGALERAMPVPGWTLPGAMTAGAAQIMLKSAALASDDAVLVGAGPLLYLVAAQMIDAGSPPLALVETQTLGDHIRAARQFGAALKGWSALAKGLGLLARIRRAGIKRYTACTDIRLAGAEKVEAVTFMSGSKQHTIACSLALLHQGVVPNTQISRALRLDHRWDAAQFCFRPVVDAWGLSSNTVVSIAGDGAGIGGARAAESAGILAALNAASRIGMLETEERDQLAVPARRDRNNHFAVRPLLDALYAPPDWVRRPSDDVVVCRCEEVTAGDIRRYAKLGCVGPNQTKAFGRCGMGPCQGRMCGLSVTEILAEANGLPQDDVGAYRIRSPLKPISLGELASLGEDA